MSAATSELGIVRGKRTTAQKIVGVLSSSVVNVVLVIVALFWLIPTIGLFLTSLRTSGDNASSGWWTVFTKPAELTIENYANLLSNPAITGSFWNTIVIAVPSTVLVVLLGAFAAYAFAWMQFPGRDWLLIVVIILLAVPVQVALIPLARLFGTLGIFGSVLGVVLFHVAFGLQFAIVGGARKLDSNGARKVNTQRLECDHFGGLGSDPQARCGGRLEGGDREAVGGVANDRLRRVGV